MILLKSEVAANLDGTLKGVRCALQQAIELEHATLPTYLYALYSLKPGTNERIARLVLSVIMEEMLHMALACNILNAVGGHPMINKPDFIPTYPGPLPGGVESDLQVPLSPFSLSLIECVFMVIEEPEDPLHFPVKLAAEAQPQLTIGQFYERIKQAIVELSKTENIFTGDRSYQLTHGFPSSELIAVYDVATASTAIDTIVEQGEGTHTSPLDPQHRAGALLSLRRDSLREDAGAEHDAAAGLRLCRRGDSCSIRQGVYPVVVESRRARICPGFSGSDPERDVQLHLHEPAQHAAQRLQRPARPADRGHRPDGVAQGAGIRDDVGGSGGPGHARPQRGAQLPVPAHESRLTFLPLPNGRGSCSGPGLRRVLVRNAGELT